MRAGKRIGRPANKEGSEGEILLRRDTGGRTSIFGKIHGIWNRVGLNVLGKPSLGSFAFFRGPNEIFHDSRFSIIDGVANFKSNLIATGGITANELILNGKLGIGTTSPQNNLSVAGTMSVFKENDISRLTVGEEDDTDESTHNCMHIETAGASNKSRIFTTGTSNDMVIESMGNNSDIHLSSDRDIRFGVNNNSAFNFTEKMIMKTDGKLGIGTETPSEMLDVAGNVNITGDLDVTGNITPAGYIDLTGIPSDPGDANIVRIGRTDGYGSEILQINSNVGYLRLGAYNSSYCHFVTDRPMFYFNQDIAVDTGLISSFNEDLIIRRVFNDTSYNQITLGDDSFELKLDNTVRLSVDGSGVVSAGELDISGDVTVGGDLTVSGGDILFDALTTAKALTIKGADGQDASIELWADRGDDTDADGGDIWQISATSGNNLEFYQLESDSGGTFRSRLMLSDEGNVVVRDQLLIADVPAGDGSNEDLMVIDSGDNIVKKRTFAQIKADLSLEIGTDVLAEQTIGIANDNLVEIDDTDAANNDYAKFTANGLEGRSYSEVRSDLGIAANEIIDWTGASAGTIHATNYVDNNTNQLTTFTLTGDSGVTQTIVHGNTLDVAGGTGISTVVGATDTVTVNVDAAQTGITSVGALNGGSITSGFGTIDTGSSTITTTGTVSTGNIAATGTITPSSYIELTGVSTDPGADDIVRIGEESNALRIQSNDGYIRIGAESSSWAHIRTDRSNYYFNTNLVVDGGYVSSYDEDLVLRRDYNDTSYNQITIGDDTLDIKLDNTSRLAINADGQVDLSGDLMLRSEGGIFVESKEDHHDGEVTLVRGGYILHPSSGMFRTNSNEITGCIKIVIPRGAGANPTDMISFWVDVFDYGSRDSFSMYISGYVYQDDGSNEWHNVDAMSLGTAAQADYAVRFCHDGSNHCITIGEVDTGWNYLQVTVRNVQVGYTSDIDDYTGDWTISIETGLPSTVDETASGNFPIASRTIGTADVATTITASDESSDTTCFPLFSTATTGDIHPKTGSNLTFNSSTGKLTATDLAAGNLTLSTNFFFSGAGTHYFKHNSGTASTDNFTFRFNDNEDVAIIRGDGRVGIGTTSPANKLQVSHTGADTDNGLMIVREDTSTADGDLLGGIGFDSTDGNVPSSVLESSAFIAAYAAEDQGTGDKGADLVFGASKIDDNDDVVSHEYMRITDTGVVSIGTPATGSPNMALEVVAGANDGILINRNATTTDSPVEVGFRHTTSAGDATTGMRSYRTNEDDSYDQELRFFTMAGDGGEGEHLTIKHDGKIGIGTASPGAALEVQSTGDTLCRLSTDGDSGDVAHLQLYRNNAAYAQFHYEADGGANAGLHITDFRDDSNSQIVFNTRKDNERMRIESDGKVGIGLAAPTTTLDVEGTVSYKHTAFSTTGPTDLIDVSDTTVLEVDTSSNDVTIGGFAGGVQGQILYIVKTDTTNSLILEHNESPAVGDQQKIFSTGGVDETIVGYGGWTLYCNGDDWFSLSNPSGTRDSG